MRDWSIGREALEFATHCLGLRAVAFETASIQPQISAKTQQRSNELADRKPGFTGCGGRGLHVLVDLHVILRAEQTARALVCHRRIVDRRSPGCRRAGGY